jgi:hypothetical protein
MCNLPVCYDKLLNLRYRRTHYWREYIYEDEKIRNSFICGPCEWYIRKCSKKLQISNSYAAVYEFLKKRDINYILNHAVSKYGMNDRLFVSHVSDYIYKITNPKL